MAGTAATPETPAAPIADEYSQVIDGVLFQGTEIAPVRIGTDAPGQPPGAEAGFTVDAWKTYPAEQNKYLLYIGERPSGGYLWKMYGMSRHGNFRELIHGGYDGEAPVLTVQAALDTPHDGRTLDRAEYIVNGHER